METWPGGAILVTDNSNSLRHVTKFRHVHDPRTFLINVDL